MMESSVSIGQETVYEAGYVARSDMLRPEADYGIPVFAARELTDIRLVLRSTPFHDLLATGRQTVSGMNRLAIRSRAACLVDYDAITRSYRATLFIGDEMEIAGVLDSLISRTGVYSSIVPVNDSAAQAVDHWPDIRVGRMSEQEQTRRLREEELIRMSARRAPARIIPVSLDPWRVPDLDDSEAIQSVERIEPKPEPEATPPEPTAPPKRRMRFGGGSGP